MDFVKTKGEEDIALAIQNSTMIQNLKDPNQLLKVITEWRIYIGVPKNEDLSEEFSIMAQFLFENYGFLTLEEIRLAFKLSITRKLEQVEFYGYFSPLYVGKVLDSYLYYRKLTMADVIRRKEKDEKEELEIKNRPSAEQQAKNMKEILNQFYKEYQETKEINDVFSIAYNFLRKHDFLKVEKEDIDLALEYGKKKYFEKEKKLTDKIVEVERDLEIKRHARNWCVQKYFKNVDFIVLQNNIKSELFT